MHVFRFMIVLVTLAFGLSACSSKFQRYNGPEVTQVVVNKGARRMYLLHHDKVLKSYLFGLGFAPVGDKRSRVMARRPRATISSTTAIPTASSA